MVRRKRKRLCRLILTICVTVFCAGVLLKAAVTTFEIRPFIMVDGRHSLGSGSVLSSMSAYHHKKTPEKKSWFKAQNVVIPHGPGEEGSAFFLPPELEHTKDELYKTNGFNALVSDFISLNRSLPDIRHPR
ncbi:putative polypeptide N-acetylgalactosaminyltransferase 10, partial [Stegodyphus mimosarum]